LRRPVDPVLLVPGVLASLADLGGDLRLLIPEVGRGWIDGQHADGQSLTLGETLHGVQNLRV